MELGTFGDNDMTEPYNREELLEALADADKELEAELEQLRKASQVTQEQMKLEMTL